MQIVHLHGFWRQGDTLHTTKQLQHSRPLLKGDLKKALSDVTLVVLGYGGWSDVFTKTLLDLVNDSDLSIDILWTFYSADEQIIKSNNAELLECFRKFPNSRVQFYKGVDFNVFLPKLEAALISEEEKGSKYAIKAKEVVEEQTDKERVLLGTKTKEKFDKYQCDNPPVNLFWIGRHEETNLLKENNFKASFITGIGGQGKSGLASNFVKNVIQNDLSYAFWDWRDCKEEDHRLLSIIISLVERISNGSIEIKTLVNETIEKVIDLFFDILNDHKGVFVFDNVDHYIDLANFYPSKGLKYLFDESLKRDHNSKFIFTCRPAIDFSNIHFLNIQLQPFKIDETIELFKNYSTQIKQRDLIFIAEQAHQTTSGHTLWLNLIAAQLSKGKELVLQIIDDIKLSKSENSANPSGTLAFNTLNIVWKHLNARQQSFMRGMAETVTAETEIHLRQIMSDLNENHFNKAFKALKNLNLIVTKTSVTGKNLYELHPLVKEYMVRKYNKSERSVFIGMWVRLYDQIIMLFKEGLTHDSPYIHFQNYLNKIELLINDEKYEKALIALHEVYEPLLSAGYAEDFQRVATRFFIEIEFETAVANDIPYFFEQFQIFIRTLTEVGKYSEAESFLNKYKRVIPFKGVQYLELNHLYAYHYWYKNELDKAIEYAQIALDMVAATNINSGWDINHTYALALRDTKVTDKVESALKIFLSGETYDDLINGKNPNDKFSGSFWGNIGRCLFFQSKYSEALHFYKKSYLALNEENYSNAILNRGYACLWITETSLMLNDYDSACSFYVQCLRYWQKTAPIKRQDTISELYPKLSHLESQLSDIENLSEWSLIKKCKEFCEQGTSLIELKIA